MVGKETPDGPRQAQGAGGNQERDKSPLPKLLAQKPKDAKEKRRPIKTRINRNALIGIGVNHLTEIGRHGRFPFIYLVLKQRSYEERH